jgi:hypothetical protein
MQSGWDATDLAFLVQDRCVQLISFALNNTDSEVCKYLY